MSVLYCDCKVNLTIFLNGGQMKNNIEKVRKERGMTQQALAAAVGVSRQTIISLENGKYSPSIELAFKLARLFEKSIEELFIYEGER